MSEKPGAGDDATAYRIEINSHDQFLSDARWLFQFPKRKKQILLQSPIQKKAGAGMTADNFQMSKFADHRQRFFAPRRRGLRRIGRPSVQALSLERTGAGLYRVEGVGTLRRTRSLRIVRRAGRRAPR